MNVKEVTTTKGFWKSVLILSLLFILIYNIITCGFNYDFNFAAFFDAKFNQASIFRFIIANLIGGFCYGFIIVFLQFRGRLKRAEKERNS
ncbi:hypothetical protein [Mesonia aquimarina]|uniref:hypothetical protein n=1 Tax=Mesonia aquimarina TaxID=1504967 RepID=UPI000EF5B13E|nr:hypothetical protein [Mesonia aquimarina]